MIGPSRTLINQFCRAIRFWRGIWVKLHALRCRNRVLRHCFSEAHRQAVGCSAFRQMSFTVHACCQTLVPATSLADWQNNWKTKACHIGGLHDAMRLGYDLPQIMNSGRWASPEMQAIYGRKLLASKSASADVCRAYEDLFHED